MRRDSHTKSIHPYRIGHIQRRALLRFGCLFRTLKSVAGSKAAQIQSARTNTAKAVVILYFCYSTRLKRIKKHDRSNEIAPDVSSSGMTSLTTLVRRRWRHIRRSSCTTIQVAFCITPCLRSARGDGLQYRSNDILYKGTARRRASQTSTPSQS